MSDDNKKSNIPPSTTDYLLTEILGKLNKAEVLNGGFDRLSEEVTKVKDNVDDIKLNFVQVEKDIEVIKKTGNDREHTLNKIHDAIYDPHHGIYSTIKNNEKETESNFDKLNSKLADLEYKIDKTSKSINTAEQKMNRRADETDGRIKTIVAIGGDEQLTNIKDAIDTHKNMSKMWWALVLAIVSGFGKFIWDFVKDMQ